MAEQVLRHPEVTPPAVFTSEELGWVPWLEPKPEAAPEQMERTAHLTVPVTGCRTTFVGGVNPWGLVT